MSRVLNTYSTSCTLLINLFPILIPSFSATFRLIDIIGFLALTGLIVSTFFKKKTCIDSRCFSRGCIANNWISYKDKMKSTFKLNQIDFWIVINRSAERVKGGDAIDP